MLSELDIMINRMKAQKEARDKYLRAQQLEGFKKQLINEKQKPKLKLERQFIASKIKELDVDPGKEMIEF